ncbi:MAG: succinyl-diaminopimelate desuccinylase [Magnetospirillum sp. WYHS-4]
MTPLSPLALAQALIRCPSVTPAEGGALGVLEQSLKPLGFACTRLPFSQEGTPDVDNLYARIGTSGPVFCFAGHTDVVPVGDAGAWTVDPFGGEVKDGRLYGRGASDMKAAVACFAAAAGRFIARRGPDFGGSISLLITGDEEGPAINGTPKMLSWMRAKGEAMDACLVGEPTCPSRLGEMMKIGRRGSINAALTVHGVQGHVGYPQRADNPIPRLMRMLLAMVDDPLDRGSEHFEASTLAVTSVDVGNPATNVISGASLKDWIGKRCERIGGRYDLAFDVSGESFLTPPGLLSDLIGRAVHEVTGLHPELSTSGGTSDARFIKDMAPVVEFGMVGESAHKVDENVPAADIEALAAIYEAVLEGFFSR